MRRLLAGALLAAALFMAVPAQAESRGVLSWTHDSDELFITSHAEVPVRFRCTWVGGFNDSWTGRSWGRIDPSETVVSWTLVRHAHDFDCRRTS